MWIQTRITHLILGMTLILTLVAANPYKPPTRPTKILLNTQWPDSTDHYIIILILLHQQNMAATQFQDNEETKRENTRTFLRNQKEIVENYKSYIENMHLLDVQKQ